LTASSRLTSELKSIESRMVDEETHLKLVNGIEGFLSRIHKSAETLNVVDRQKILRLVGKRTSPPPAVIPFSRNG
jgi:hypothetical protein